VTGVWGVKQQPLGMAQACSLADKPAIHGREQHKADALKQVPQSCSTPTQRLKLSEDKKLGEKKELL
jgi:hypothetical protein